MKRFTTTELSRMRAAQDAAMQDACQILTYSAETDAYGNPSASFSAGAELWCGFEPVDPSEVQESGEVPVITARLRLPVGTVLDERDHVLMVERYGETMDPTEEFEVAGPVRRGPSGLVVDLVRIEE